MIRSGNHLLASISSILSLVTLNSIFVQPFGKGSSEIFCDLKNLFCAKYLRAPGDTATAAG